MKISPKTREKAFRLRLERRPFTEVSKEVGVSAKTLARWEAGWIDAQGRSHAGWKPELERLWREKGDAELQYGLMLKEERLKTYEELARLAVAKIKECFPNLKAKTAADAKALLSEIRELCRLIARERGELNPDPRSLVAVKADINLTDLRDRFVNAQTPGARPARKEVVTVEAEPEEPVPAPGESEEEDADRAEEDADEGRADDLAEDA